MTRSITLSCSSFSDLKNKVAAIKALRGLTGAGLADAKDLVERITPGHVETVNIQSYVLDPLYSEYVNAIRLSGLTVAVSVHNNTARNGIASEIRKIVTYATMTAQYDIGRALLNLLETYCPDPEEEYKEETDDDSK